MKTEKKFKLAKDAATSEFNNIVEAFNFNISTEAKERIVKMKINSIDMETSSELVEADSFIQKIMTGKIKFDEERTEIVYTPKNPIITGENDEIITPEFRFGKFTRAKQIASKVPLNKCNFATLEDDKQNSLLMALTGISDDGILNSLEIQDFNDLRMIGGYFFN